MSPAEAISMLDRSLKWNGQQIRLERLTLGPNGLLIPFGVTCWAAVRGYAPEELVGGITQNDSKVIISPTDIIAAQWPGPATGATTLDRRVPVKGDRAIIGGRVRNVETAVGVYLAGELVRIEIQVRG